MALTPAQNRRRLALDRAKPSNHQARYAFMGVPKSVIQPPAPKPAAPPSGRRARPRRPMNRAV